MIDVSVYVAGRHVLSNDGVRHVDVGAVKKLVNDSTAYIGSVGRDGGIDDVGCHLLVDKNTTAFIGNVSGHGDIREVVRTTIRYSNSSALRNESTVHRAIVRDGNVCQLYRAVGRIDSAAACTCFV